MAIACRAEIRAFANSLISCRIAVLSALLDGGTEGVVPRSADSRPNAAEIEAKTSDINAMLRIDAVVMGPSCFRCGDCAVCSRFEVSDHRQPAAQKRLSR